MAEKDEMRKIQFTGKSSYIVSLPKKWIAELGLKRGDQVRMTRQGALLQISASGFQAGGMQKDDATIEVGAGEETAAIIRRLISLYFLGFKTIHVRAKDSRLDPGQRMAIKDAVKRMLMGSEITADSSGGMTIQVLVNLLELTVSGAFKRMIHLAKSMLNDAILAVREGNLDLAREVINTDDEVDRFGFYIIRQLKLAIQYEHMLKQMGFENARECLGYRLVVKNIERTGDHAALIAGDLLEFKKGLKRDVLERIQEMGDYAISMLDEACLALFKGDYIQAEKTIGAASGISGFEKKVLDSSRYMRDHREVYRIRRMTENVRRIAEYASDIAEIVLNINVEKTLKKS